MTIRHKDYQIDRFCSSSSHTWWGRESWLLCLIVFLVSSDGWAALPRGATGLSAVCDCGIFWSYSLTILEQRSGNLTTWAIPQATLVVHNYYLLSTYWRCMSDQRNQLDLANFMKKKRFCEIRLISLISYTCFSFSQCKCFKQWPIQLLASLPEVTACKCPQCLNPIRFDGGMKNKWWLDFWLKNQGQLTNRKKSQIKLDTTHNPPCSQNAIDWMDPATQTQPAVDPGLAPYFRGDWLRSSSSLPLNHSRRVVVSYKLKYVN